MKYFSPKIPSSKTQKGFALLLAVVIAGILISITFIMFSISLKQITLSTTGKNSQYSLYAADTGIECALDADYRIETTNGNVFADIATTNANCDSNGACDTTTNPTAPASALPFNCNNQAIVYQTSPVYNTDPIVIRGKTYPKAVTTVFKVIVDTNRCAIVTVSKYASSTLDTSNNKTTEYLNTKIESRGYNSCTNLDPQRLERGLEVYY